MSQATQTSVKPRHGHHHQYSDAQLKVKPIIKQQDNNNNTSNNNNNQASQQNNTGTNINNHKKNEIRQTKSATVQINTDRMEQNNPNPSVNNKRSKSKSARKNKNKAQNQSNQNNQNEFVKNHNGNNNNNHTNEKKSNNSARKIDFKSISNMAVQTPLAWNLRDYNKTKPKRPLSRSASVSNLQPRRVPFANYGWATKTKDLSLKPTHNALANKVILIFLKSY